MTDSLFKSANSFISGPQEERDDGNQSNGITSEAINMALRTGLKVRDIRM